MVGKMFLKWFFIGNCEIFFDCFYWWVCWVFYCCFVDVEWVFCFFVEWWEIVLKLVWVMKFVDWVESVLLELVVVLCDCSILDVVVYMDVVFVLVEKKIVEGVLEFFGVGDERLFNWWDFYGFVVDLGFLNEIVE